ncbi:MAG: hypothetical protein ACFFAJ_08310 [Candidatus Hodarchaeota archaeon]
MEKSDQSFYHRYIYQFISIIYNLGSLKFAFLCFIILHFSIGAIVPPLVTSDYERNLFYGRAFWEHGFSVYDKTPLEIDPNYNIGDPTSDLLSYPNTTYDYPTLQLLFWASLAPIPFSSIIAKWVLSSFDIINFFLLYFLLGLHQPINNKEKRNRLPEILFALSYLLFSIPFSAIEGQSTALTVFFLLLPLSLHSYNRTWSYFSIGLGFHWKYVSVLILPYLLFKDREELKLIVFGFLTVVLTIAFLSFPLLFSNFILNYFGFFGNLGEYSGQRPSNPLLLFHPSISSLLSTGVLVLALLYWFGASLSDETITERIRGIPHRSYWLPFILLLGFLKIYATAFPWYWMWFYACLSILPQKERRLFIVLLGITFAIGLIDFVVMTVGLETFINYFF